MAAAILMAIRLIPTTMLLSMQERDLPSTDKLSYPYSEMQQAIPLSMLLVVPF
jgi:hypothetical protein